MTTLVTQASISAANNGGDLGKVLKDLGSKESIKSLAVAVVTAGIMDKVSGSLNVKIQDMPFAEKLANNFIQGAGSTLISTSIQGGSLSDNLQAALLAGLSSAVQGQLANKIGIALDGKTGTDIEYVLHKIAHAAAGCVAGAIQKSCEAGAIGAVVGEIAADFVPMPKPFAEMTPSERDAYSKKVLGVTQVLAGTVSAYAGYDVNIAANSADIAVRNNFLYPKEKARFEAAYVKCTSDQCRTDLVDKYADISKINNQDMKKTCLNTAKLNDCYNMVKHALNYAGSDFWNTSTTYSLMSTSTGKQALNALKQDQIISRDWILDNIFNSPDIFYKAINDIEARADFFSAMYQKTGAEWFKLAEDVSRDDLQGLMFNGGNLWHITGSILPTIEKKYNLDNWRSEAGASIMKLGYNDFKTIYTNYNDLDLQKWSINRLVSEQIALQPIHEKYIPEFIIGIKSGMQILGGVEDILNIQSRIDTGCKKMGLKVKCGVAPK